MALDPRIRAAVIEATSEAGQPSALADKLIAWLDSLSSGNESLTDRDSVYRHLELLYDSTHSDIADEPS